MTATAHAIIGTVIAAKIGNPALAIPIAFASHFVADAIPHWDAGTHRREKTPRKLFFESALDVLIGFAVAYAIIYFLFPQTNLAYAFFIIIIAQLPDWLMAPYAIFHINFPLFKWAYQIQSKLNVRLDKPWGIINQVAILVFIVILAKISQ